METEKLTQLLDTYKTLCTWCDTFFAGAHSSLKRYMRCGPGCATCCTLTTVTRLEAHAVKQHLQSNPQIAESIRACAPGTRAGAPAIDEEMCPLLLHRECSIYAARPVICRTHGLAVRHRGTGIMPSCLMNFQDRDVESLEQTQILDADRVTENLMRLNLAYCRLTSKEADAQKRVRLADLL